MVGAQVVSTRDDRGQEVGMILTRTCHKAAPRHVVSVRANTVLPTPVRS
jgi:hypothetical protein